MMKQKNIDEIVFAKVAGEELTQDELAQFDSWYADGQNRLYYESLLRVHSGIAASGAAGADTRKAWKKIAPPASKRSAVRYAIRYAAILAIPLISAIYLIYQNDQTPPEDETTVKPGSAMAILTSPSGNRFILSETEETRIENGGGVINIKGLESVDGEVGTAYGTAIGVDRTSYAMLEIPRGGNICYVLSDGSKVWLNSESRLRFPMEFADRAREVELEGEAYFQVVGDPDRPFTVRTGDYDIHVTGTEFNVRSYGLGTTSTVLVEGSVEVDMNGTVCKLSPGSRATIEDGRILNRNVDVERYVAWRYGAFHFTQTPLGEIMDDLTRWYDIDVVWENPEARNYHFSAWFDRKSEIGDIIDVLKKTNRVDITMKGKTLTIKDKKL